MSIECFNFYRKYKPKKKIQYNIIPELVPHNEATLNMGDIIVLHVDIEQFDIEEAQRFQDFLEDAFPNNGVITMLGNNKLEIIKNATD